MLLASLGCAATVMLAMLPLLQNDNLARRIKAVSVERERIRMRERERLSAAQSSGNKPQLAPQRRRHVASRLVDTLNLTDWLSTETAKQQARQAGFRGAGPEYAFLAFRLIAPIAFFILHDLSTCSSSRISTTRRS